MIEAFFLRPAHLNMDDYADWIEASLQQVDPAKAARLKAIQEQIDVPFRLRDTDSPADVLPKYPDDQPGAVGKRRPAASLADTLRR